MCTLVILDRQAIESEIDGLKSLLRGQTDERDRRWVLDSILDCMSILDKYREIEWLGERLAKTTVLVSVARHSDNHQFGKTEMDAKSWALYEAGKDHRFFWPGGMAKAEKVLTEDQLEALGVDGSTGVVFYQTVQDFDRGTMVTLSMS